MKNRIQLILQKKLFVLLYFDFLQKVTTFETIQSCQIWLVTRKNEFYYFFWSYNKFKWLLVECTFINGEHLFFLFMIVIINLQIKKNEFSNCFQIKNCNFVLKKKYFVLKKKWIIKIQ